MLACKSIVSSTYASNVFIFPIFHGLHVKLLFSVFLQKVIEKNDRGDHFPLYAVCLGFELLTMIISEVSTSHYLTFFICFLFFKKEKKNNLIFFRLLSVYMAFLDVVNFCSLLWTFSTNIHSCVMAK